MARVTRAAAAKAAKAIVNLDIVHEDAQMSEGDSEAHEEASGNESNEESGKPRPAKRTRISSSSAKATKGKGKPSRKGKKSLSLLPTMPLDVLYEIFSALGPKDIINLSRTSKIFRDTLLTRNATTVWKAAREREDAPDCPPFLSEPQWAVLLFGYLCQICGAKNIQRVDFQLLRRVCVACKKRHLIVQSKFKSRFPTVDKFILDLVPYTDIGAWSHGFPGSSHYYWDTDIHSVVEKLAKYEQDVEKCLPDAKKALDGFKTAQRDRIEYSQKHWKDGQSWLSEWQGARSSTKYDAHRARVNQIKQKFLELGYIDSDLLFLDYERSQDGKTAQLSERIWQRIRPELEARALTNKNQRLEREHAQLRMARRTLVSNRYDDYTRTLSPSQWKYLPRPLDICSFEPFRELITADPDITVTAQSFDEAFQMLPELLSSAAEERRNSKLALLPLVISDSVTDPLELATSAFYCQKCSKSSFYYSNILFGWNDIASHHCGVQTAGLFSSPSGNEVDNPGAYYMEAVTWVRKIAEKVGLDPATATVVEMDSKDVRFTCTTCPIQHMRGEWTRVGYCWRRLVLHAVVEGRHYSSPCAFEILSPEDATKVKEAERSDKKWQQSNWTCAHCPEHLNDGQQRAMVVQHLQDMHAISAPIEPTDLFFFERYVTPFSSPPRYTVPPPVKTITKPRDSSFNLHCLQCAQSSTTARDRLFNIHGVLAHLQAKHGVKTPVPGSDYLRNA